VLANPKSDHNGLPKDQPSNKPLLLLLNRIEQQMEELGLNRGINFPGPAEASE
jgi:hypothetical protein